MQQQFVLLLAVAFPSHLTKNKQTKKIAKSEERLSFPASYLWTNRDLYHWTVYLLIQYLICSCSFSIANSSKCTLGPTLSPTQGSYLLSLPHYYSSPLSNTTSTTIQKYHNISYFSKKKALLVPSYFLSAALFYNKNSWKMCRYSFSLLPYLQFSL